MTNRSPTDPVGNWRRVTHVVGFVAFVAVVGVFVAAAVPQVVGADHSYVVRSDSMSPALDAGGVVFVSDVATDRIAEGDVVTFERGGDTRVTHRVVAVVERDGKRRFRTMGDANEDPDPDLVAPADVVGVVRFHVPFVGYVVSFAQTRLGVLALVVVPGLLLVAAEIRDLYVAASASADEQEPGEDR